MLNIFKIQFQVTGPLLPSRSLQICHTQQYNNHVVNYTKCIHVVATLWCHFLSINVQFYCQCTFVASNQSFENRTFLGVSTEIYQPRNNSMKKFGWRFQCFGRFFNSFGGIYTQFYNYKMVPILILFSF